MKQLEYSSNKGEINMTASEELANKIINSSTKDFQQMTSEELKELREFLDTKSTEISWVLKGRAKARAQISQNNS